MHNAIMQRGRWKDADEEVASENKEG